MTIIRTIADLTPYDVRRIKRGRYEILVSKHVAWRRPTQPRSSGAGRIHPMPSERTSCHTDAPPSRIRGSGFGHAQRREWTTLGVPDRRAPGGNVTARISDGDLAGRPLSALIRGVFIYVTQADTSSL
jgi:hypothetical protein